MLTANQAGSNSQSNNANKKKKRGGGSGIPPWFYVINAETLKHYQATVEESTVPVQKDTKKKRNNKQPTISSLNITNGDPYIFNFLSMKLSTGEVDEILTRLALGDEQATKIEETIRHLAGGDIVRTHSFAHNFQYVFSEFIKNNKAWHFQVNEPEQRVIFFKHWNNFKGKPTNWLEVDRNDFPIYPGLLVLRKQSSGYNYLHAPVTLLHYHIVMNTEGDNAAMADINAFEAHRSHKHNKQSLFNLIMLNGRGGIALDMLAKWVNNAGFIYQAIVHPSCQYHDLTCTALLNVLERQPIMISEMRCEESFLDNNNIAIYHTVTSPWTAEARSMVAIGCRRVQTNEGVEFYFLCQYWFERKYFVEVSAKYLYECQAKLIWIKDDYALANRQYPEGIPCCVGNYFESAICEEEILPIDD